MVYKKYILMHCQLKTVHSTHYSNNNKNIFIYIYKSKKKSDNQFHLTHIRLIINFFHSKRRYLIQSDLTRYPNLAWLTYILSFNSHLILTYFLSILCKCKSDVELPQVLS